MYVCVVCELCVWPWHMIIWSLILVSGYGMCAIIVPIPDAGNSSQWSHIYLTVAQADIFT